MSTMETVILAFFLGLQFAYLANNSINFHRKIREVSTPFFQKCLACVFFNLMAPFGFLLGINIMAFYHFGYSEDSLRLAIQMIFSNKQMWGILSGFYITIAVVIVYFRNFYPRKTA